MSCYMLRASEGSLTDWTFVVASHCRWASQHKSQRKMQSIPTTSLSHAPWQHAETNNLWRHLSHFGRSGFIVHPSSFHFIPIYTSIAKRHYRRPLLLPLVQLPRTSTPNHRLPFGDSLYFWPLILIINHLPLPSTLVTGMSDWTVSLMMHRWWCIVMISNLSIWWRV